MVVHFYFCFHKPFGTLSQFINNGPSKPHHRLLGDWGNFPQGTMAVGRLDRDSEGLLLLTTDGIFSEVTRAHTVEKQYWVQVDGQPNPEQLHQLRAGPQISIKGHAHQCLPAIVSTMSEPDLPSRSKNIRSSRHGPTSWLSITLTEGKFRQVRKMTATVGLPTLRLVRVRVGDYLLGELEPGQWRPFNWDPAAPR